MPILNPPLPTPRRLLIVKTSALGDIVHALPLAESLRHALPNAHIAWLVKAKLADLLQGNPHLDSVLTLPDSGVATLWRTGQILRREQFDTVLDAQGLLVSGVLTRLSGAPVRVGWSLNREQNTRFLTHPIVQDKSGFPIVESLQGFLDVFGLPHSPVGVQTYLAYAGREKADTLLAPFGGKPVVACIVGAGWAAKMWPVERWIELARLLEMKGMVPILLGSAGERETARAIADAAPVAQDLTGQTPLRILASVLARCAVVVGGDSGPSHLAVAVGTPVVGLYGVTDPARSGPDWGFPPSRTLDFAKTDAPPALRRGRHPVVTDALSRIPAQAVADAVYSLVQCEANV